MVKKKYCTSLQTIQKAKGKQTAKSDCQISQVVLKQKIVWMTK